MGARNDVPTVRRRLGSMLYDSLLLLGVLIVGVVVPHILFGFITGLMVSGAWLWLHVFVLIGIYFIWYWRHGGRTLAMQTWKIKLTDMRGQPPSYASATLRYLLAWPSLLVFGGGILWALVDRDRQFLHDRLAGTQIVSTTGVLPTTTSMPLPAEK